MGFIKLSKLFIGKVWYICRLATTIVMIGASRVQMLAHGLPQSRVNRTHGTFHFIKYYAFIGEF